MMTQKTATVDLLEAIRGHETTHADVVKTAYAMPVVLGTIEDIVSGTILLRSDIPLPKSAYFEAKQYGAWKILTGVDGFAVERRLSAAGWHFFFVVPEIKAAAVSSTRRGALRKALKKVTSGTNSLSFNALEIAKLTTKRFLGLYYVKVVAYKRHIKDSPFLRDLDPYHVSRSVWDSKQVLRRRGEIGHTSKGI